MLKRGLYCFLIFGCFFYNAATAQKQANNWYFGKKAGLNFNQSPPQLLFDGIANSIEGSAAISDNNGNLLFYTNGIVVINKQHELMQNGNGIMGDLSSTNNTVIVPFPETDSIFYLFTIGSAGQFENGLRYSIININRNGGLGEVTEKNILLYDNTFEKIAAVRHCNKKDVWITVKDWETDAYNSYLLTKNGFAGTIVSNMGLVTSGLSLNALGTLKFSSDGKKLIALHSFENDAAQLMNFDNSTGVLSDPVVFKPNDIPATGGFTGLYGAAFSPDNRLLYISSNTSNNEKSKIYQFDITQHTVSDIMNSRYTVTSNNNWIAGALQTGPDGKIYYAQWKDTALSVIDNPDAAGIGCNYQSDRIYFPGITEPIQFGLPNFIASDLDSMYVPFDYSWEKTGGCNSLTIKFVPNKTIGIDSVKWNFGDGNLSQALFPEHDYAQAGVYTVTMQIFKQDCGEASETLSHVVNVGLFADGAASFLPTDTSFCEMIVLPVQSAVSAPAYTWNTGATSRGIVIQAPGLYWLEITRDGCLYRDSINVIQNPAIQVELGADQAVCINKPVQLEAISNGAVSYLWNTGYNLPVLEVNTAGTYWVEVTNASGCIAKDTVKTYTGECDTYIPSAFSPNGDGINETFGLINGINSSIFTFYIYNRYGQLIFTSNDPFKKWDGKIKGKPCVSGMYVWMMTYKNKEGFIQTDKGTVMLIR